jgi:hypothetical protein
MFVSHDHDSNAFSILTRPDTLANIHEKSGGNQLHKFYKKTSIEHGAAVLFSGVVKGRGL